MKYGIEERCNDINCDELMLSLVAMNRNKFDTLSIFELKNMLKICTHILDNNIETTYSVSTILEMIAEIKYTIKTTKNKKDYNLDKDTVEIICKVINNYLSFYKELGERSEEYKGLEQAISLISCIK